MFSLLSDYGEDCGMSISEKADWQ